jgi:hypothetical protein
MYNSLLKLPLFSAEKKNKSFHCKRHRPDVLAECREIGPIPKLKRRHCQFPRIPDLVFSAFPHPRQGSWWVGEDSAEMEFRRGTESLRRSNEGQGNVDERCRNNKCENVSLRNPATSEVVIQPCLVTNDSLTVIFATSSHLPDAAVGYSNLLTFRPLLVYTTIHVMSSSRQCNDTVSGQEGFSLGAPPLFAVEIRRMVGNGSRRVAVNHRHVARVLADRLS